jgi:superfamily II DNA or RNA helicase
MVDYRSFIESKRKTLRPFGFTLNKEKINRRLFPWQRDVVEWALRRGRAALFEDCGLGKTLQQLEWAAHVWRFSGKPVVVHCPVGVRSQTKAEAEKFEIAASVAVVDEQGGVIDGINLVNYEKMHKFNPSLWGGVVLDESSVLKSFTGSTKRQLIDAYRSTPYRLACTATPAPNDFMELGNHADFLGVLDFNDMLSRWFINDTMKAGGYRLRGHAVKDFWRWVSSWAVCLEKPSDIGGNNAGYDLPEMIQHEHLVDIPDEAPPGLLFAIGQLSATTMHHEKRRSAEARARVARKIIGLEPNESWIIWCDTNYEADALIGQIPGADVAEVRGSEKDAAKESKLLGFAEGKYRILITKPEIAGFGLNYQHCARVIFVGLSFSYERFYQAIRRTYRFGQTRVVHCHTIATPAENAMRKAVLEKQAKHEQMKTGMADAIRADQCREVLGELDRARYSAAQTMRVPSWIRGC